MYGIFPLPLKNIKTILKYQGLKTLILLISISAVYCSHHQFLHTKNKLQKLSYNISPNKKYKHKYIACFLLENNKIVKTKSSWFKTNVAALHFIIQMCKNIARIYLTYFGKIRSGCWCLEAFLLLKCLQVENARCTEFHNYSVCFIIRFVYNWTLFKSSLVLTLRTGWHSKILFFI